MHNVVTGRCYPILLPMIPREMKCPAADDIMGDED